MANLAPYFDQRWYAADGVTPASGYKLFTYAAGTATKKATYTNYGGGTANDNPIVLSSTGTITAGGLWLGDGLYKFVLCLPTETDPITGTPVKIVDNVGFQSLQTVSTLAALRALTAGVAGDCVHVLGYSAAGDGGEGFFYAATSSASEDYGCTIVPGGGGTTRWFRCHQGEINVKWFGCKGDGSTDDTTNFGRAETYANTNHCGLYLPAGTYMLDNATLRVDMRGVSKQEVTLKMPDVPGSGQMFAASGSIKVSGLTFDGNDGVAGIAVYTLDTLSFNGTHLEVYDCQFQHTVRSGIEIVGGDANIHDCIFTDMMEYDGHTGMYTCAVYAVGLTSQNVKFCNNKVYQDAAAGTPANAPGGVIVGGTGVTLQADNNFFNYLGQVTAQITMGCISATTAAKINATGNVIKNSYYGIYMNASTNNVINGNQFLDCTYGVEAAASSSFVATGNMNNSASGTYGYEIATGLAANPCKIIGDTIIGCTKGVYAITANTALQLEINGTIFGSDTNDVHAVSCLSVKVTDCTFTTSAAMGALKLYTNTLAMVLNNKSVAASPTDLSGNTTLINLNNSWQGGIKALPTGATPAIDVMAKVFYTNQSGDTTITNFTGGVNGYEFTLVAVDAYTTTLTHGSNIVLAGAQNVDIGLIHARAITLVYVTDHWEEKSRQMGSILYCSTISAATGVFSTNFSPPNIANATQPTLTSGYATMWCDTDDSNKVYLVYNDPTGGAKKVQLT